MQITNYSRLYNDEYIYTRGILYNINNKEGSDDVGRTYYRYM